MEYSADKFSTSLESEGPSMGTCRVKFFIGDMALRVSLFAATVIGVVFMVTSKQTELVAVPGAPVGVKIPLTAKFNQEPAFVYLVIALSILIFGVVVSATGAAGAVGYVGWKGDGHVGWSKVCPIYDKFCGHAVKSIAMSLLAAVILVLLNIQSIFSLHKQAHD
ncbi:CASP-like protein 1D1 [Mangifera indica]|uniref:CASP-like protein 1D1 n=1 Tax=Mangifera indica TaxID=29780 RepID=UPI001CFAF0FB|nr:CASP-like protein 1D1 [Mangifera indica]